MYSEKSVEIKNIHLKTNSMFEFRVFNNLQNEYTIAKTFKHIFKVVSSDSYAHTKLKSLRMHIG